MTHDNAVSVLNNLIETTKDGEKGFKTAAEGLTAPDIKHRVLQYSSERAQMAAQPAAAREVRRVAERAGFEPATGCPEPHFQCGAIVH